MSQESNELASTRWALIRRLRNWDDQEGWREFFRIYWKLIYGVAVQSGLSPQESEDVVQETVISVCKSIKMFEADPAKGSFKSWLLNVTRWRIKDQYRKRRTATEKRVHLRRDKQGSENPDESTATEDRIPDPDANVLDRMWDEEWQRNLVETALEAMKKQVSNKQFQIFYLHAIKSTPAHEVAQALGISVNQVYINKHRLGGMLKEEIEKLDRNQP